MKTCFTSFCWLLHMKKRLHFKDVRYQREHGNIDDIQEAVTSQNNLNMLRKCSCRLNYANSDGDSDRFLVFSWPARTYMMPVSIPRTWDAFKVRMPLLQNIQRWDDFITPVWLNIIPQTAITLNPKQKESFQKAPTTLINPQLRLHTESVFRSHL